MNYYWKNGVPTVMRTMSALRPECRKFAPNIFNKTKCSNCFKQREEHSAEALECNRASRKVSKCGYLFVAPGWDFSNPINRTKRWQRRWFVLYDDGEFTYSVDEHPETVPQCIIDMNSVLEVTPAEDITGHAHSIALTAPDGVHFVKGTSLEESRWWCEVLSVFLRSKGRHKRNATFPGGKSTTMLQPSRVSVSAEKSLIPARPRFNSCHTEPVCRIPSSPLSDVFTPQPSLLSPTQGYEDQPASSDSPPTRDKLQSECKTRYRRALARDKRAWRSELATIDTDSPAAHTARHLLLDDETRRGEKLKDIADCITRPRRPTSLVLPPRTVLEPTRDTGPPAEQETTPADKPVRGDPDGCGLDSVSTHCFATSGSGSSTAELRVDLPAEDLLHLKKGWLMKQVIEKQDWVKHWFVLRGSALMYYRDPSAEDNGILDGVIDLGMVQRVVEIQVARNYGFEIVPWDEKRVVVSAVTAGIRGNWVQALRRAAGLPATEPALIESQVAPTTQRASSQRASLGARLERQLESATLHRPVTRLRAGELGGVSSDEEYRTASSETSAGAHSEWGDAEEACVAAPLPSSSPPLNRTPISRVKERARSRVARRSRTSPPPLGSRTLISQRRRTLPTDSTDFPERLPPIVFTPSPVSETSTLLSPTPSTSSPATVSHAPIESHSETRLKALETQLAEALTLLEVRDTEVQAKVRELAELQQLSQRYSSLRQEHQLLSQQWRERIASEEQWRHSYQQAHASLECEREENEQNISSLRRESEEQIQKMRSQVTSLQNELDKVKERLQRGIEENESLCAKLREVKASPAMHRRFSRRSLSRVDSLSDLASCTSLEEAELSTWDRDRLEEEYMESVRKLRLAVGEIHAARKELRARQAECDQLEIETVASRQAAQQQQSEHQAREALLARRVDDLTLKLSAAERQLRQLPPPIGSPQLQKLTRGGEKRRSLSLRGRESMQQVSREMEEKLADLENKLATLTRKSASTEQLPIKKILESPRSAKKLDALCLENKASPRLQRKSSRRKSDLGPLISSSPHSESPPPQRSSRSLRRKSLDSSPSLELLLRLRVVESKLTQLAGNIDTGVVVNEPELVRSATSTPTGDRELLVVVPECYGDESSSTSVSQSTEDIARPEPCATLVPSATKLMGQLWQALGVTRNQPQDLVLECKQALEASDTFMTEHRLRLSSQPAILMQMATVSALAALLRRCLATRDPAACQEIAILVNNISGELSAQPSSCKHCDELQQTLESMKVDHAKECSRVKDENKKQNKEWQALVSEHEQHVQQMEDNIHRLEARLGALDSEYSQQVAGLRASYQLSLEQAARGVEGASVGLEEGVRQRYKAEIQQLRALCEKGLVAMENSHRRIVAELREEHEQQIEQLRQEKEEALAEETQATLAALDAMRKAHEVEVQREIDKFKSQFLDKLKASPDVRQLHREHEQEMTGIRREILSLSEKYSLKCMETAQLEEQLSSSSRQLQHSQQLVSELENRNQQLRQHIISDTRSDSRSDSRSDTRSDTMAGPDSPCSAVSDSFLLQSPARNLRLRTDQKMPRPLSHQPSINFALGTSSGVRTLQGMVAERKKIFEK